MNDLILIDEFNDNEEIKFRSNATQKLVDAIAFSGPWAVIKDILLGNGYIVIEQTKINLN